MMKNLKQYFLFLAALMFAIVSSFVNFNASAHYYDVKNKNNNINTQELVKSYLEASAFRHKVLSENIANANTPGYKANEVYIPEDLNQMKSAVGIKKTLHMKLTSVKHINGKKAGAKEGLLAEKLKDPYEEKLNGNNVSIPQQMTKMSENQANYDTALKSASAINSLIATSISNER